METENSYPGFHDQGHHNMQAFDKFVRGHVLCQSNLVGKWWHAGGSYGTSITAHLSTTTELKVCIPYFTHILQGYLTGTGPILGSQWSNPEECQWMDQMNHLKLISSDRLDGHQYTDRFRSSLAIISAPCHQLKVCKPVDYTTVEFESKYTVKQKYICLLFIVSGNVYWGFNS